MARKLRNHPSTASRGQAGVFRESPLRCTVPIKTRVMSQLSQQFPNQPRGGLKRGINLRLLFAAGFGNLRLAAA